MVKNEYYKNKKGDIFSFEEGAIEKSLEAKAAHDKADEAEAEAQAVYDSENLEDAIKAHSVNKDSVKSALDAIKSAKIDLLKLSLSPAGESDAARAATDKARGKYESALKKGQDSLKEASAAADKTFKILQGKEAKINAAKAKFSDAKAAAVGLIVRDFPEGLTKITEKARDDLLKPVRAEAERQVIISELDALDLKRIRPLSEGDTERLEKINQEAVTLREKLAKVGNDE